MKIAFVYTPSRYVWSYMYRKYAWLRFAEYNVQLSTMLDESYSTHSAWQSVLKRRGHECLTCLAGTLPLEESWVAENGRASRRIPSSWQVVIEQVARFQPDIVYCNTSNDYSTGFTDAIRCHVKSVQAIIGYAGSYTFDAQRLSKYDAVITCSHDLEEIMQEHGLNVFYIPHAFDSNVDRLIGPLSAPQVNKVVFSGNLVRRGGLHLDRERLLKAVVAQLPIAIYTQAGEQSPFNVLLDWGIKKIASDCSKALTALPLTRELANRSFALRRLSKMDLTRSPWLSAELRRVFHPPVLGLDSYRIYRSYAVTLNHSGEFKTAENLRLFEATGVGACLLTDWKPNLPKYFDVDREIVTFNCSAECVEKARWLLSHPVQAQSIGAAARKKCLSHHTFECRVDEFESVLRRCL